MLDVGSGAMLDAVAEFGALGVVPVVDGADEVAGDAADAFKVTLAVVLGAAALWAFIADDAGVAADGITVDRMVDRAVADSGFLHAADSVFKRLKIRLSVAVKLDIADVSAVGEGVVWSFPFDLVEGGELVVNRDMEAVRIIRTVGDAFYDAVFLRVDADEAAGKSFRRSRDKREVEPVFLGCFIGALAHETDDLETQILSVVRFAVVLADERLEGFGKTDETDGKGAVLERFGDAVVGP